MRKKTLTFLVLTFFSGLSAGICAEGAPQAASSPVMLISPLDGNKSLIRGWQPAMGQGISEMLAESLEGSNNKFQILEPTETADSPKESGSAESDSTKSGQGASARSKKSTAGSANSQNAKGNAGSETSDSDNVANSEKNEAENSPDSDFTFCGDVMEFAVQTNSTKIGDFMSSSSLAGFGGKLATAHVEISWRIIDTATKRIIKRGTAVASASGSEFNMADLSTANDQASGQTKTSAKTTASAKNSTGAKSGATGTTKNNNFGFANNIFSGLNKALGNSSAEEGESSQDGNGTTTKSAKPAKKSSASANAGGDVAEQDAEVISYDNPEFMGSALGKATAEAVTNIVEQLAAINLPESTRITKSKSSADALKHTAGKILAFINNSTIIISLGSKQGFKNGDQLEIYQANDIKDDKGNVVFTDEKLVGEITISEVQDEKSLCSYSGDAKVQQGWTVKAK
jgi:hypothetical protein